MHVKMLFSIDVKLTVPPRSAPRLLLPDSSKIGFAIALYHIEIKYGDMGPTYTLHLENLFDKLFTGPTLNHHIMKKEWSAAIQGLTKFEQPVGASSWTILLSDCRSLSYARRMRDSSSRLFQEACFISSFANVIFGFRPGNYVGLSDSLTRQYANSTMNFQQK